MSKIEVGSRVKLTKPAYQWGGWVDSMTENVNKEFIVENIKSPIDFVDYNDDYLKDGIINLVDDVFNYPFICFELVEEKKMKFAVGDRVKVVKKVTQENGWYNSWVGDMSEAIGNEYTILNMDKWGIYLDVPLRDQLSGLGFPPSSLELVGTICPEKKIPQFKIGNQVKITKAVHKENGWVNCWNSSMDKFVGTIQTIKEIRASGVFFEGICDYGFPPSSLELYVETVKSTDPIVKYQYFKGSDLHTVNNWADNLCLTVATKIKTGKVTGEKTVEWAVSFKHPKDKFDKSLARGAVNSKIPKLLFLNKQYSRDEIITKILADLVYNDYFLSDEYRKFVRLLLADYSGVM